jgi:hypothetical protein
VPHIYTFLHVDVNACICHICIDTSLHAYTPLTLACVTHNTLTRALTRTNTHTNT